jgi:hypothetical protein
MPLRIVSSQERLLSFEDIRALAREGNWLYVRWSGSVQRDLETGRSWDPVRNKWEQGLSCVDLSPFPPEEGKAWTRLAVAVGKYCALSQAGWRASSFGVGTTKWVMARPWILTGLQAGRDSDNQPAVRLARYLGHIHSTLVKQLLDYYRVGGLHFKHVPAGDPAPLPPPPRIIRSRLGR